MGFVKFDVVVIGSGSAGGVLAVTGGFLPRGKILGGCSATNAAIALWGDRRALVVDASVMPEIPAANTNIPTMMVAERVVPWLLERPGCHGGRKTMTGDLWSSSSAGGEGEWHDANRAAP